MRRTSTRGRRPALDCKKKKLLCDAVSRGATMTQAAVTVGVSLRTVQRSARLDPEFDQELRIAHTDKADPLDLMQSAARTHWRAAAWLLERTNPEDYGRRPAFSCSPFQFEEALKVVVDAALRLTPQENRSKVYACLTETSETAFKAVFPTCGPGSRRLVKRLPDTPLADQQRRRRDTEPQFQRVVFEDETCRITESSLHEQPPREAPDRPATVEQASDPFAAPPLKPRALPGGKPPSRPAVATDRQTSGPRPESQRSEQAASVTPSKEPGDSRPPAVDANSPPSAPEGRRHVARGASPWIKRATKSKPQRGDVAPELPPSPPTPESPTPASRLSWRYLLRAAGASPLAPRSASLVDPTILSHLSPKTRVATEQKADDTPFRDASVSRDAVAERANSNRTSINRLSPGARPPHEEIKEPRP